MCGGGGGGVPPEKHLLKTNHLPVAGLFLRGSGVNSGNLLLHSFAWLVVMHRQVYHRFAIVYLFEIKKKHTIC